MYERNVMRKNQIVDEAFKLFARQGYSSTTMQQIGDAVGLDKSSLYVHFSKKGDIYMENLSREFQVYERQVIEQSECGGDHKTLMRCLFVNSLQYFSDRDRLLFWKQAVLLARSGINAEMAEQSAAYINRIKTCVYGKLSFPAADDKTQKMSLCSMVLTQGFMDWFLLQDSVDDHDIRIAVSIFDNIVSTSALFN